MSHSERGSSIFKHTVFSTLSEEKQEAVRALFKSYCKDTRYQWGNHHIEIQDIFDHRDVLTTLNTVHKERLAEISPVVLRYLPESKRHALQDELLFAFFLFSAQYYLDEIEHCRQHLREQHNTITQCAKLITYLRTLDVPEPNVEAAAQAYIDDSDKPLKYLGLTVVAPQIVNLMDELSQSNTAVFIDQAGDVNERRLYWVWGGGIINTAIELLPDTLPSKSQAQWGINLPAPFTGYMSWILYYARFGVGLGLLLKHTLKGPWMSAQEAQIPTWERFKTQWQQRKFALLNDSIWATANLACFFWLTGKGALGYWGDVLTAGLLLLDVSLAAWRFAEESTHYEGMLEEYQRELDTLEEQIAANRLALPSPGANLAELHTWQERLQAQKELLEKNRDTLNLDYIYKKYGLINDLSYAVGLLAAFSIVCCFFFPPATMLPATTNLLGVVGAALCFTLTVAYPAVASHLNISKLETIAEQTTQHCNKLLASFVSCPPHDARKKQLYLDIKHALATTQIQQENICFQKAALVRSIFIDLMIPPLIFTSLVFLPLGVGLPVIAAGLVLAWLSSSLLNPFKPTGTSSQGISFNEREFAQFTENPTLEYLRANNQLRGFFSGNNEAANPDSAEQAPHPSPNAPQ